MKIIIQDESDQVYVPDYGVPTIQLGDGFTTISDVHGEDGFHGICFSEAITNDGVGADRTDQVGGGTVDTIDAYFQILTKNPASLQVLIDKLELAKDALTTS